MIEFHNAWLMGVPFLLPAFFIGAARKDIAQRMSDMTGYNTREKTFTVAASLAPYPFLIATLWIPFTSITPLLCAGIVLYCIGIAGFYAAIWVFSVTPPNMPLSRGIYRFSRNPMYVTAALVFFSMCLVTANILLLAYFIVLAVLQHVMIHAEERICRQKYGSAYQKYLDEVPRYLLL
jgi:protein-S-isoprenylcysteine O-methyltransferase Ste14